MGTTVEPGGHGRARTETMAHLGALIRPEKPGATTPAQKPTGIRVAKLATALVSTAPATKRPFYRLPDSTLIESGICVSTRTAKAEASSSHTA